MSYRIKKLYYICFSHYYAKIKVDSYDFLPLEKTLTFQNILIRIMSVWNQDQNYYYYNIFLEKCSYHLPKNSNSKVFV